MRKVIFLQHSAWGWVNFLTNNYKDDLFGMRLWRIAKF